MVASASAAHAIIAAAAVHAIIAPAAAHAVIAAGTLALAALLAAVLHELVQHILDFAHHSGALLLTALLAAEQILQHALKTARAAAQQLAEELVGA
jgi:hypothetical protein